MIKIKGYKHIRRLMTIMVYLILIIVNAMYGASGGDKLLRRWQDGDIVAFHFVDAAPVDLIYGENNNVFENKAVGGLTDGHIIYEITKQSRNGEEVGHTDKVAEVNSATGQLKILRTGTVMVKASSIADSTHNSVTAEYTVTIKYLDIIANQPYTIQGERKNTSGWYTSDVVIVPINGFSISRTDMISESNWSSTITECDEGSQDLKIHLRNNTTGGITDEIIIKDLMIDKTPPEVSIAYSRPDKILDPVTQESVEQEDEKSIVCYKGPIVATITIEEANFFEGTMTKDGIANDVMIEIMRLDTHTTMQYVPYSTSKADQKHIIWDSSGDIHTTSIELTEDGDYVFHIKYKDHSGNEMILKLNDNQDANHYFYEYTSNQRTIDKTEPIIKVKYLDDNIPVNGDYFNNVRKAEIQIIEHNFSSEGIEFQFVVENITGAGIQIDNLSAQDYYANQLRNKSKWKHSGDDHRIIIDFNIDGIYTFQIKYTDLIGYQSNIYSNHFVVDRTKPDYQNFTISYGIPINDMFVQKTPFLFYKTPVEVTLTAEDIAAGIDHFTYWFEKKGTSTLNKEAEGLVIKSDRIIFDQDKKTATAKLIIPAQFRGKVVFTATDKAGNTSEEFNDNKIIVVDNISPKSKVIYTPNRVVNRKIGQDVKSVGIYHSGKSENILYYNKTVIITVEIKEDNFYAEDVVIQVENKKTKRQRNIRPKKWRQEGDVWTGEIKLEASPNHRNDGTYQITISYTDRSNNKMRRYQSDNIVIDTIRPKVKVDYIEKFKSKAIKTAVIQVIENNFRADDIMVNIEALDISGVNQQIPNYSKYLRNRENWVKRGNVYTVAIDFRVDANYTVDITYEDLACNPLDKHHLQRFTIDTTPPANLQIGYSESVFDDVLQGVPYSFYNSLVRVTITAADITSGINHFTYSYANNSNRDEKQQEHMIPKENISYSTDRKTAKAIIQIPRGLLLDSNQFQGRMKFTAYDTAGNHTELKDTREIIVDTIPPAAQIIYSKPVREAENIKYYSGDVTIKIVITEKNFYPEDVEIKVSKDKDAPYLKSPTDWRREQDSWVGTITLSGADDHNGDGDYIVYVDHTDKSSNKMKSIVSQQLTIDTTIPIVTVSGIRNQSANKADQIGGAITVVDQNLDVETLKPELTAVIKNNQGHYITQTIDLDKIHTIKKGKSYLIKTDNLKQDGIYTLSCCVTDMSGNKCKRIVSELDQMEYDAMQFSVNRKGSTFLLDNNSTAAMTNYFIQAIAQDVVITEVNADKLIESSIRCNGKALIENIDYHVSKSESDVQWNKYVYTINKELFREEGAYSLIVSSTDGAGAKAFSDIKGIEVAFTVDKTKPQVIISGLRSNSRYQVKSQRVKIAVRDDGGRISAFKVSLKKRDGSIYKIPINLSDQDLQENYDYRNIQLEFEIPGGMDQGVEIECADAAGNKSTVEFSKVTVSTRWYVIFYANKATFYGSLGAVMLIILVSLSTVIYRRKSLK